MATEARVRRELDEERRQLADAVEILREDLGEAAGKAKKVSLGAAGGLALLVAAKKLLRLRR
jgi:hypothetical protein